jgi:hypothetical protein
MSRPLDIHDLPENVVRFHQPHKPHPLGYDVCCGCLRLSELYEEWPMCRWCADSFCPFGQDCQQPGTLQDNEGRETCVCATCTTSRTCEKCKASDVETREVQTERGPDVYERRCQRCNPKAWETQDAWEGRYEAI